MMFYFAALPVTAVKVKVGIPFWRPLLRSGEHPTSKQTFAQKMSSRWWVSTQLKRKSNVTIVGVFVLKRLVIALQENFTPHPLPSPNMGNQQKTCQGTSKAKTSTGCEAQTTRFRKIKHIFSYRQVERYRFRTIQWNAQKRSSQFGYN